MAVSCFLAVEIVSLISLAIPFWLWRLARNRVIISAGFLGGLVFPAKFRASAPITFSRLVLFSASHAV